VNERAAPIETVLRKCSKFWMQQCSLVFEQRSSVRLRFREPSRSRKQLETLTVSRASFSAGVHPVVFGWRHPEDRAFSPARRGIWRGTDHHPHNCFVTRSSISAAKSHRIDRVPPDTMSTQRHSPHYITHPLSLPYKRPPPCQYQIAFQRRQGRIHMQLLITAIAAIAGLVFSIAIALLVEELIFGKVFRLFFTPQPQPVKAELKR
jgi:hypothetical protein